MTPKGLHINFARDLKHSDQKLNLLRIFTFYYKYLKYKKIFIIKETNSLVSNMLSYYRFCQCLKWKSGKASANGGNKRLVMHVRLGCGSLSITRLASKMLFNVIKGQYYKVYEIIGK